MHWEDYLGVKLHIIISGLVGGIIALTFEEKASFRRAILLIFTGAATAAYTNSAIISYFGISDLYANALGFITGLSAMKIIPLLIDFVIRIVKNPNVFIKLLTRDTKPDSSDSGTTDNNK